MDLRDKFKNRYNIITFILILLILAMSLRLSVLTIAQGDYYRNLADNKRLKEVYTNAPRGEIRDRNGKLLAGNKPSFAVRLFKDEINLYKAEEKNQAFLKLVRLMEEDGINYVDEFPIELNTYSYRSEADYINEELSPDDKVVEIIRENNLIAQVLYSNFTYAGYEEHYQFMTVNRAINALQYKGIDIPIESRLEGDTTVLSFEDKEDIEAWKQEYGLNPKASPMECLISLIGNDKTLISKVTDHSISRQLIYEILSAKGLSGNIILNEYSISYLEEFRTQKRSLNQRFPEITMDTEAIDDFLLMFSQLSLESFLTDVYLPETDKGKTVMPAQILKDMIQKKGSKVPIDIELSKDDNLVVFKHKENEKMETSEIINILIKLANEEKILKDFISRDDIKYLAQSKLLSDGLNPRISIAQKFEYAAINNLKNFYTQYKIKDETTVKDSFESLYKAHGLEKNLSKYEARGIFVLYNQLKKQGYLGYQPIYLAYGLKESTVAKIEEGLMDFSGADVSIGAVRYYPEGTTAAHILGYLGKISQSNEIEKYIKEMKYSPGTIIGKTGIEESFEEKLSGSYGIKKVEVDSVGNTTSVIEEIKPVPGDNIYLSLDLDLQKVAEKSLEQTLKELQKGGTYISPWGNYKFPINTSKRRPYKNATSGAVVAIDVKTGQVLASASYPSYDPNLFSTGISDTDWVSLFPEDEKDPLAPRPLYNIVTQTSIQPGSVFKMATALTALDKGLSPNKKIRDMGYVDVGAGEPMKCLLWTNSRRTHGNIDVYHAIKDSCNYYFYSLAFGKNPRTGENIGVKIDIEDVAQMSTKLGLNDKTGIEINIPSERAVGVPNPEMEIAGQKNLLRNFLNRNIEKYFEEDFDYDEDYKKEIVDEITSWIDEEQSPTRGEVIRRLEKMHIRPEFRYENERAGIADQIKFDYLKQANWTISDMLNITIGQGLNSYTPIQMANYVSTLVNGGYRHKLSLVDSIKNYNNTETSYIHEVNTDRIELNDYSNLDVIKQAMLLVSNDGISRRTFGNFPVKVGSKTGTAERSGKNPTTDETYDDFSWFVGFAPYDNPQIAVAAVIFQGGSGSNGSPMVRDIIAQYLGLNNKAPEESLPFDNTSVD